MTGAAAIGLNPRNRIESAAASFDSPPAQHYAKAHKDDNEHEQEHGKQKCHDRRTLTTKVVEQNVVVLDAEAVQHLDHG